MVDMGTVFFHIFSPSLFPRQLTEIIFRQVFWLTDQIITLSSHKSFINFAVIVKVFIPDYSGGSALDFNEIPYYLLNATPELSIYKNKSKKSSNIRLLFFVSSQQLKA